MDWASLTPVDTIEHGFVRQSREAFGLCDFHVIARGTDLSSVGSYATARHHGAVSTIKHSSTVIGDARSHMATYGKGIDFALHQKHLHHLYEQILQIPGAMLRGRAFWLDAMRSWLLEVQEAFDSDRRRGFISASGHWKAHASQLGILGLQLMVQTGRGPDLSRVSSGTRSSLISTLLTESDRDWLA